MSYSLTYVGFFFFSSRRRHTRFDCDWSSDVCSSDLCGGSTVMVLVNAYAMRLAGIDRTTQDVPGGEIVRDSEGDRESVGEGKRVDFGGCRIIKKKKIRNI